ncbi:MULTISPECIES: Abi-alpha family protein [Nocardia]|uniref:Abi-alpha family protein n=1 Tax=Nocardia TaxID=1817 RepID=UPI001E3E324B|nr:MULTISPECIES: Abi-alpha family protein [Nocardia]
MAMTDADGDGGDIEAVEPSGTVESASPTPSTELARRPAGAVDLPEHGRHRPSARDTVRAATGVAKVAVTAAGAVTAWSVDTALGVGAAVVRGSIAGTPTREVLADAEAEFKGAVRKALGISAAPATSRDAEVPTLREQGAALLKLSASTHADAAEIHPAFARMLADLTPDEARILRFLHLDGPQPSIDIRTGRPRGLGAERVVSGLNLIGDHAGLRFPNRIQQYLPNLRRLGLIDVAHEPVGNPNRYQILEAQSPVREVLKRSGFGTKVYYRSIVLTGFGADFVQTCLPVVVPEGRASGTS